MSVTDLAAGFITAAAIKGPCRVATPGVNITLNGLAVLDAITLIDGDRVLVKDQTAKHENGIWIARAGNWERAGDFDSTKEVTRGTRVFVTDGFAGANTEWWCTTLNPVPVGTGAVTFAQASTTGAAVPPARKVEAGEGLSGGGDLTQNRSLKLNIAGLDTLGTVDPAADYVAVVDASDSGKQKKALAGLIAAAGSVPSSREITAGAGLSGGGALADDVALALDLSEVTAKAGIAFATDQLALHDPALLVGQGYLEHEIAQTGFTAKCVEDAVGQSRGQRNEAGSRGARDRYGCAQILPPQPNLGFKVSKGSPQGGPFAFWL